MGEKAACADHSDAPALVRCASCDRALCDACFRFTLDDRPACARCAYETATRPQRRVSLAVMFLCFAGAIGFWVARRPELPGENAFALGLGALVALIVAIVLVGTARDRKRAIFGNRDVDDGVAIENAFEGSASPYRAHARRVLLAVSPRISGKATALVIVVSLIAAAVLVPASVRLPRWIEAEMVLALWWLVLASTLFVLLYRGFRLRDDFVYFAPWDRPSKPTMPAPPATPGATDTSKSSGRGDWFSGCSAGDGCSGVDGEGCVGALAVGAALAVAFGAAWIFVELALPLAFGLLYAVLMRAIRRAAIDRRGCAGDIAKSLGWAVVWATIYVVPIAGVTWAMHGLHR
jgi:hypothetical protein